MSVKAKITPCLWFAGNAEEAATFYTSIFPSSAIQHVQRYTAAGQEHHHQTPGSAMLVQFSLNEQQFTALNGPAIYQFTPAISFQIDCKDQVEVDHFWSKLGEGGEENRCGWVKDKFGISWQVIPKQLAEYMSGGNKEVTMRVSNAMMGMTKLEVEGLKKAFEGK